MSEPAAYKLEQANTGPNATAALHRIESDRIIHFSHDTARAHP
jgi:hypothetical protein